MDSKPVSSNSYIIDEARAAVGDDPAAQVVWLASLVEALLEGTSAGYVRARPVDVKGARRPPPASLE